MRLAVLISECAVAPAACAPAFHLVRHYYARRRGGGLLFKLVKEHKRYNQAGAVSERDVKSELQVRILQQPVQPQPLL